MNRYAPLEPLFPIVEDQEGCWEHNCSMPCAQCEAEQTFAAKLARATSLERQAKVTRSITVSDPEDQKALQSWADHLDTQASRIRGALQREADRQARESESQ